MDYSELSRLPDWAIITIVILVFWTIFWKGLGMWHAARKKQSGWFIILLIFNTVGILDMIYLFGVAKIPSNKLFK